MTARTIAAGLFGAFVAAWLARAAFKWILDVEWWLVATAVCAVVGAAISVSSEHEARTRAADE